MQTQTSLIAWLALAFALAAAPAAQALPPPPCCHLPAGARIEVELVDGVSSKTAHAGDAFALRLAAPVVVDGRVVLRAGAPGRGEVVEAARRGMGGKGAKLVLAARYLGWGHTYIPLQGLQLAGAGHDNTTAAQAVGLTGIAFGPLGLIGLAVPGGSVTFAPGTKALATVAADIDLRPLSRATRREMYAANEPFRDAEADADDTAAAIDIPPPPPGQGQVVFFRRKSLMGTGQWFKVRENGAALGKLDNGAYFALVTVPGRHTYTATMEPELKDHLTLEVAPGETYFVEGTITKALVVGAADLTPSDRATFDHVSGRLKAAKPEGAPVERAAVADDGRPRDANATEPDSPGDAPSAGQR